MLNTHGQTHQPQKCHHQAANYTMGFEKIENSSLRESLDFTIMRSCDLTSSIEPPRDNQLETNTLEESIIDKLRIFGTNVKYMAGGIGQRSLSETSLWMLGKQYTSPPHFKRDYESIIYCSYRRNFPRLVSKLPVEEGTYTNDTSWGCMIRASQMMFCEVLKRKLKSKFKDETLLNREIIRWLIDGENAEDGAPYSIQSICDEMYSTKSIKPGQWFKASQVLLALQSIHRKNKKITADDLESVVFIDGTVYLDQILNRVCPEPQKEFLVVDSKENENVLAEVEIVDADEDHEELKQVEEEQRNGKNSSRRRLIKLDSVLSFGDEDESMRGSYKKNNEDCLDGFIDEDECNESSRRNNRSGEINQRTAKFEAQMKSEWTKAVFFVVLVKIGLDEVNPQYTPCIQELLSYPESVGMIGGRPGNAYYFVGYQDQELIYLDPHFVQDSCQNKSELNKYARSYSCNKPRTIPMSKIDTSIAVGFYIDNAKQFQSFVGRLKKTSQKGSSFFGVEKFTPIFDEFDDGCFPEEGDSKCNLEYEDYEDSSDDEEDYDVL